MSVLMACATQPAPQPAPDLPADTVFPPSLLQPAEPPSASKPDAAPVLRYAGHIASYKTLTEAEAAWPRLADRFPAVRDASRRYVEVDLGGQRGKVVRLLLGGFADQPAALAYCRTLRGAGLYCAPHDLPA